SGSFNITAGQVIKVEITGSVSRLKRIFESNNVDGVEYDQTTSSTTVHTYTFTVDADKDYTVNGSVQNP
ncbi:MAG TPA: hypothetical protein VNS32_14195, partial [Flavisolibacter sp.]|nr:hypothetical protein [Flavisolibacter sp.]